VKNFIPKPVPPLRTKVLGIRVTTAVANQLAERAVKNKLSASEMAAQMIEHCLDYMEDAEGRT